MSTLTCELIAAPHLQGHRILIRERKYRAEIRHEVCVVTKTLVLGGGGLAGIAWQTGVLAGLAAEGVDVAATADRLIGTSAGANVAAQLASGLPLDELFARQADPARQNEELTPTGISGYELLATLERIAREAADPIERRRRVGEFAVGAQTVGEAERRAVITRRLPEHGWPARALTVVAVDAATGETRLFDAGSGAGLVDAVAASSAVPGVWPPVTIGDRRYVDGGVRTMTNADLAAGADQVLVLAPLPDPALEEDVAGLRRTARVAVLTPNEASVAAFGIDPLNPAVRTPSAHVGLAQGREAVDAVRRVWE